jgi:nitroreductase
MTMPTESRPYVPVARPISTRSITDALHRAVSTARYAPSADNAQPWRWRLDDDGLDLFLDPSRVADPGDRLAAVGCGAALQHARLALAALGWRATVTRRPDAADPRHLARLHIDAVARIGRRAVQAAQNVRLRHTDPRPVTGGPLGAHDLESLTAAVEAEGGRPHVLRPDEIRRLRPASPPAADLGPLEAQWYEELGRAATFVVLHGHGDEQLDWLRAGEALSAAWLVATEMHVSVLPLSAPVQGPAARDALRRTVGDLGHPYLVVRLGRNAGPAIVPRSPRLPLDQIVEVRGAGAQPRSR